MITSRRLRASLLWALCAFASTMVAAGPRSDTSYVRDFRGWEVVCDNVKRCVAEGAEEEGNDTRLVVWLWRDAGPDGPVRLQFAADKPVSAALMRVDNHPFPTDPSKWKTWREEDAQTYQQRLSTADASVVNAWVEAARDARTLSFGDPSASGALNVSLAGLSAALLAIDDVQGRVATATAWRRSGVAPASSVPVAKSLPIVGPAKSAADLSEAERSRLVNATFARFHAEVDRCDEGLDDPDDKTAPRQGSTAVALSASEAAVSLACGDSDAYNDTSLWYRVRRQPPLAARPLDLGENTGADDGDDPPPRNELIGAVYDARRGELVSFERARSAGDCGALTTWIFDGTDFVVAGKRFQGACFGLDLTDWPWLYRTKRR